MTRSTFLGLCVAAAVLAALPIPAAADDANLQPCGPDPEGHWYVCRAGDNSVWVKCNLNLGGLLYVTICPEEVT